MNVSTRFIIAEFLSGLSFHTPIWILFFQSRGLDYASIGLIASMTYAASLLFEYPSGMLADQLGYRQSLLIALLASMAALVSEVLAWSLWPFLLAGALVGVSSAFTSGAREAFIARLTEKRDFTRLLGRADSLHFTALIIAAPIGSLIAARSYTYPYVLSILATLIASILLLTLPNPKGRAERLREHFHLSLSFLRKPFMLKLFILYLSAFFFEEAWYMSYQPYLVQQGLPLVLLGVYSAARNGLASLQGFILPRLVRENLLIPLTLSLTAWTLTILPSVWLIMLGGMLILTAHQAWYYAEQELLNHLLPEASRASILSARQAVLSLLWLPNPLVLGILLHSLTPHTVFTLAASLSILTITLYPFLSPLRATALTWED